MREAVVYTTYCLARFAGGRQEGDERVVHVGEDEGEVTAEEGRVVSYESSFVMTR